MKESLIVKFVNTIPVSVTLKKNIILYTALVLYNYAEITQLLFI